MRLSRRRLLQLAGASALMRPRAGEAQPHWWPGQAVGPAASGGGSAWTRRGSSLLDGRPAAGGFVVDFKDLQGWGEHPTLAVASDGTIYCAWVHNASPEANGGPSDPPNGFIDPNPAMQTSVNAGSLRVKKWNAAASRWDYVAGAGNAHGTLECVDVISSGHWDGSAWVADAADLAHALAGRVGHTPNQIISGVQLKLTYAQRPSLLCVGSTPYLAFSEAVPGTSGYSVDYPSGTNTRGGSVYVGTWTGSQWNLAADSSTPVGSLAFGINTASTPDRQFPRWGQLATVGGTLYCAYIQTNSGAAGTPRREMVAVKTWTGTDWSVVGTNLLTLDGTVDPISGDTIASADMREFVALALVAADTGTGTKLHLVRAFFQNHSTGTALQPQGPKVDCWRWTGSVWETPKGTSTPADAVLISEMPGWNVAACMHGGALHVATCTRVDSGSNAGGPLQARVWRWSGSAWAVVGSVVLNTAAGTEARSASLVSDGVNLWVAWEERPQVLTAPQAGRAAVYVRSWNGTAWSTPEGPLNQGAGDSTFDPVLALAGGVPWITFAEYDEATATQQVYVLTRGTGTPPTVTLTKYGAGTPFSLANIPDRTWVLLPLAAGAPYTPAYTPPSPGPASVTYPGAVTGSTSSKSGVWWSVHQNNGGAKGTPRGYWITDGYKGMYWSPNLRRYYRYTNFNDFSIESERSVLYYDVALNEWHFERYAYGRGDADWPHCTHDEGGHVMDTRRDLLFGFSSIGGPNQCHVYDIKSHRGKRLSPLNEIVGNKGDFRTILFIPSASDPDQDLILRVTDQSVLTLSAYNYPHNQEWVVTMAGAGFPALMTSPFMWCWDPVHQKVVMMGGYSGVDNSVFSDVYEMALDFPSGWPAAPRLTVTKYAGAISPAMMNPIAFDSNLNKVIQVGGMSQQTPSLIFTNAMVTWDAATHTAGTITMANAIPPTGTSPTLTFGTAYTPSSLVYDATTKCLLLFDQDDPWRLWAFRNP